MMDPVLVAAAAAAIKEGVSLLHQYASGDASAETLLLSWLDARKNWADAKAEFAAEGGTGVQVQG